VAAGATIFFFSFDALLVASCAIKFFDGGWFPIGSGLLIFRRDETWWQGRALLLASIRSEGVELEPFHRQPRSGTVTHVERTAIYPVATRRRAAGAAGQPQAQPGAA